MKELHCWEISTQELRLIKSALLGIDKRSLYWEQAQAMAEAIPVEPLSIESNSDVEERRKRGAVQEEVIKAVATLNVATAKEISEATGINPNAVNSTLTRLLRKKMLDKKMVPNSEYGKGRGKKAEYVAAYSISIK
jgi:Tat protein secretion system quality control protein TatD with DNase activity